MSIVTGRMHAARSGRAMHRALVLSCAALLLAAAEGHASMAQNGAIVAGLTTDRRLSGWPGALSTTGAVRDDHALDHHWTNVGRVTQYMRLHRVAEAAVLHGWREVDAAAASRWPADAQPDRSRTRPSRRAAARTAGSSYAQP